MGNITIYETIVQLLRERLLFATVPKGFIGNVCLSLLDLSSRCTYFSPKERESMIVRPYLISLYRVKQRKLQSSNGYRPLLIKPFGILAHGFKGATSQYFELFLLGR